MVRKIIDPIVAQPRFVLFMYLLGFISMMIIHQGGRHVSIFELAVDVYILSLLLYLVPKELRKWLKGFIFTIAYSLALVDMYCFCKFGAPINASLLRICLETNQREATEALGEYLSWSSLPLSVILIIGLLTIHIYTGIRKTNLLKRRIPLDHRFDWLVIGFLLFCIVISLKNKVFIFRNLTEPKSALEMEYASEISHSGGFYLPFYRLLYAFKSLNIEHGAITKLEKQTEEIHIDSCTYKSPDIVLIIGEAYNRYHSQLYGYDKATTPQQMRMARDSSLVVFNDVISPYHQTSMVFRLAFSLYSYGAKGEWTDYPLFPQLFRKAGYQVTFITNQFVSSPSLDIFDFSGSLFVNNPILSTSMFSHRNQYTHKYDIGLLADYDSLRQYKTSHNLTIFHLLGQHTGYADRHPDSINKFHPTDYHRPELNDDDLYELSHYDNACLYNDKVVVEIIKRFEDREAIIIYMPDHGEMCYDGSSTFGRTLEVNTRNEVKQQFEIPFWIWTSNSYKRKHSDIVQQIQASKGLPFMTDNISQILLYLAGIHCSYYIETDNPLSPKYNKERKRMIMGTINYDEYIRKGNAKLNCGSTN